MNNQTIEDTLDISSDEEQYNQKNESIYISSESENDDEIMHISSSDTEQQKNHVEEMDWETDSECSKNPWLKINEFSNTKNDPWMHTPKGPSPNDSPYYLISPRSNENPISTQNDPWINAYNYTPKPIRYNDELS